MAFRDNPEVVNVQLREDTNGLGREWAEHAAGGAFLVEVGLDDFRVHVGREHIASCGAERPRAVEADPETFANAPGDIAGERPIGVSCQGGLPGLADERSLHPTLPGTRRRGRTPAEVKGQEIGSVCIEFP